MDPLFNTTVIGNGPTRIIAVHGWMGDHRLFDPLYALIDRAEWTVAFPDCRGYGARKDIAGAMTVEEIAADVLSLADHLGWARFHVLGHSMAGMAAQRLMIDAPDRIESAMLLAPVPASGARIDDARRGLLKAGLVSPEMRLALIDANTGKVRDKYWLRSLCRLSITGTRPEVMEAYMASWTGEGFAEALRGNLCPTSIVIGDLDPGTPQEKVQATYDDLLGKYRIEVLARTGHYAMQESPLALVKAIYHHLDWKDQW